MLEYKFDKDAVYIAACTFGPDAMALIDMMIKEGLKPVCAAVNYNKFRNSSEVYEHLATYCKEHDLIYEYLDADTLPQSQKYHEGDDFNDWARHTRYEFFRNLYMKYDASALVLPHQEDDLIEAYLRQKDRQVKGDRYGYSTVYTAHGMMIVRPLLHYSREDILAYNDENHVPYSMEEDRFENEYTRSEARKVIAALSEIERDQLLQEMQFRNEDSSRLVDSVVSAINEGEELNVRTLISLSQGQFATTMTQFIGKVAPKAKLTPAKIKKIRDFLLNEKETDSFRVDEGVYIIKEYDTVTVGDSFDQLPYSYKLEAPGVLDTDHFYLDFSMGAEDRKIMPEDYPLTIRTAIPSDSFVCNSYLQPVRTLYSVWEMPVKLRYIWPIFVNKNGKIVYVPKYRKVFEEYHSSVLKMKIK